MRLVSLSVAGSGSRPLAANLSTQPSVVSPLRFCRLRIAAGSCETDEGSGEGSGEEAWVVKGGMGGGCEVEAAAAGSCSKRRGVVRGEGSGGGAMGGEVEKMVELPYSQIEEGY